jgi:Flp pilus assembly pilin Flp
VVRRRRILDDEQGVAALEFALLAPIFFAMLSVLIDLSIFFTVRAVVDNAVDNAARAVRLGVLQVNDGGAGFKKALCSKLVIINCNGFSYSVQVPSNLGSVDTTPALNKNGQLKDQSYDPGGPDDVVVVTIVYVHHFIIPYVADIFGDNGLNDPMVRPIISFLVVKNEPFPPRTGS